MTTILGFKQYLSELSDDLLKRYSDKAKKQVKYHDRAAQKDFDKADSSFKKLERAEKSKGKDSPLAQKYNKEQEKYYDSGNKHADKSEKRDSGKFKASRILHKRAYAKSENERKEHYQKMRDHAHDVLTSKGFEPVETEKHNDWGNNKTYKMKNDSSLSPHEFHVKDGMIRHNRNPFHHPGMHNTYEHNKIGMDKSHVHSFIKSVIGSN